MNTPKIEVIRPLGTEENPFTSENYQTGDCGYKYCRCGSCNEVGLCTPNNDYILCAADSVLRCPSCFKRFLTGIGVKRFTEETVPEQDN